MQTIAIDFHGVLCERPNGPGIVPGAKPIAGAIEYLKELVDNGYDVVVHGASINSERTEESVFRWIETNTKALGIETDFLARVYITEFQPRAHLYINDRAFRFDGEYPSLSYIANFQPWYKR